MAGNFGLKYVAACPLLGVIKQRTRDGTESFFFLKVRFIVSYIYIFNKSTLEQHSRSLHMIVWGWAWGGRKTNVIERNRYPSP